MEKNENKNKHLPLYGIGPALCCPMALLSAAGIWLANKGYMPGKIDNVLIRRLFLIIGILLIIEGVVLFFGADLNGNLQKNIKANKLKTNGSYKFVRNPCYCLFLLGSAGALFIYANWILLAFAFFDGVNGEFWSVINIAAYENIRFCSLVSQRICKRIIAAPEFNLGAFEKVAPFDGLTNGEDDVVCL